MAVITDADYMHGKSISSDLEMKNVDKYHDLYLKSYILLLAGLEWQSTLKKVEVKLKLLTNIYMILMVEKGIRGGICHGIHQYA